MTNAIRLRLLKLVGIGAAALAFPGAALAVSQTPPKPVVGAGTINVPQLLVRKAPDAKASVIAKLSEFRPQDYRPRYVLALAVLMVRPQGLYGERLIERI